MSKPQKIRDSQNLLTPLLLQRDLILVTGKGGVGKSSLVAALAKLAAKVRGHSIAVEVSSHPHLLELTQNNPDVSCVNIDLDAALPAMLGRMLHIPKILSNALNNRVLRMFAQTSPAASELLLLDEIFALVERAAGKNAPVIVDLPATGHAVSFLGTPSAVKRMLRVGPVAHRAGQIEDLLRDHDRCELLIVAIPEELPVNETIELVSQAQSLELACHLVVANQVPLSPLDHGDDAFLTSLGALDKPELEQTLSATQQHLESKQKTRQLIDFLDNSIHQTILELGHFPIADPAHCVQKIEQQLLSSTPALADKINKAKAAAL